MSRSRSPHIVLGWHDSGNVDGKFAYCVARAVGYEGNRIKSIIRYPGPYVEEARNKIVEQFLLLPYCEWLLMMDADIDFEKDAVSKTMLVGDVTGADVVWGNYALGTFSNSLFFKDPDGSEMGAPLDDIEPGKVYNDIYAGGTGWCLIRRSLLERMKEEYPGPWHWFERDLVEDPKTKKKVKMGEDLTFGKRVFNMKDTKQVGYTGVFLVHNKKHPTVPQFMAPIAEQLGLGVRNNPVDAEIDPLPIEEKKEE